MATVPTNPSSRNSDDYRARAELHRPQTMEGFRDAAQQMLREGFSDHGIAHALRLHPEQVRRLLGPQCVDCA